MVRVQFVRVPYGVSAIWGLFSEFFNLSIYLHAREARRASVKYIRKIKKQEK